jgi:hypothetical protein
MSSGCAPTGKSSRQAERLGPIRMPGAAVTMVAHNGYSSHWAWRQRRQRTIRGRATGSNHAGPLRNAGGRDGGESGLPGNRSSSVGP